MDLLRFAGNTLEIEANAVTDNPLVLVDSGMIVSGGNFHAEPVGFAADQMQWRCLKSEQFLNVVSP